MKTKLIVFFFLFLCLSCAKRDRVINYPVIDNKNTSTMEIYQVELADTATILRAEMYNRPNYWVRLSPGAYLEGLTSGKKYKLLGSPDFELDKEVYMPESGNHPVTLLFEPIDQDEEAISFIEGAADGDFHIEGIQLKKRQLEPGEFECLLEGEVIDRPQSSRLTLKRAGKDSRTTPFISIPVKDGKFKYTLIADVNEMYELVFWEEQMNGAWCPFYFISEKGVLHFTLYPMEHRPHGILQTEAVLNKEEIRIKEEMEKLYPIAQLEQEREQLDTDARFYSKEMYELRKTSQSLKTNEERTKLQQQYEQLRNDGKEYSEEGKALSEKFKQYFEGMQQWKLDYIKKEPTLNGLCLLREMFDRALSMARYNPGSGDISVYPEIFEKTYKEKFPSHPYVEEMERSIASLNVKVGGSYIDFSAPDLEGNQVKLSDQIKGKVALIDLWASWCGPCRRTSKSMIPVYEAFKDKGFVIVGVARENNNTKAMEKAIEQDKYPWLNLVELNDTGNIWDMYGVGNSGGCTYLIDKDGKILSIHPTAEEVTKILTEKLP